ncbi:unnamed protein product, partial [Trichogramma brassicae]
RCYLSRTRREEQRKEREVKDSSDRIYTYIGTRVARGRGTTTIMNCSPRLGSGRVLQQQRTMPCNMNAKRGGEAEERRNTSPSTPSRDGKRERRRRRRREVYAAGLRAHGSSWRARKFRQYIYGTSNSPRKYHSDKSNTAAECFTCYTMHNPFDFPSILRLLYVQRLSSGGNSPSTKSYLIFGFLYFCYSTGCVSSRNIQFKTLSTGPATTTTAARRRIIRTYVGWVYARHSRGTKAYRESTAKGCGPRAREEISMLAAMEIDRLAGREIALLKKKIYDIIDRARDARYRSPPLQLYIAQRRHFGGVQLEKKPLLELNFRLNPGFICVCNALEMTLKKKNKHEPVEVSDFAQSLPDLHNVIMKKEAVQLPQPREGSSRWIFSRTKEKKDDVPKVKPLDNDGLAAARKTTDKPSSAKKSTIELKPKPEIKKPIVKNVEATTEAIATTLAITTNEAPVNEKKVMVELPILVRGEPLIPTTAQNVADVSTEATVSSTEAAPIVQSPRGRALNVSASEPGNTLQTNTTDLSDISMDDEDKEVKGGEYIAMHNVTSLTSAMVSPLPTVAPSMCVDGNKTYAVGQKIQRGCDEWCRCVEGGKVTDCKPLTCTLPLVKTDETKNHDPLCHVQPLPEFPCCATLDCPDSAVESEESCIFGNTTIQRGQRVEDGCAKTCVCEEGGHLKCQPRCPPNDTASSINQHDRCVVLPDPSDSCCTITLCDVTLGDHEIKSEGPTDLNVNLTDVKVLNSTSIKLKLSSKMSDDITVEISENNHVWRQVKPTKDGIITNLLPAHGYYVRIVENSRPGPAIHVSLLAEVTKTIAVAEKSEKGMCTHRGKSYKIGAEWYDECIAVCFCNETAQTECVTIECPTDFGLDVLDPHCLDWETVPPNHVPKAPNCCPQVRCSNIIIFFSLIRLILSLIFCTIQEVLCRNNGSCTYEGKTYDNWSRLPTNVTGCEKECFCEFGNVTCNPACPPVPQLPPMSLNCKSHEAILTHLPGDDCCLHWACPQNALDLPGFGQGLPPIGQFPPHGGYNVASTQTYEVAVEDLRAISANSVRLMFTVPSVLVGLHGRVEVRYTSDKSNSDPLSWKSQTFAPPGDLIDTEDLEFDLSGLKPSTLYRLMIVVKLRDLANTHTSKIYQVRTLDKPVANSTPAEITIDSELRILEINSTYAEFEWKKFSNYELQFIDGVYLMYRAENEKTYSVTPLLHKSVNHYVLDHLQPSTMYEVHLSTKDIIGQTDVLIDSKTVNFTTTGESDPYSFDVRVEIKTIKATEVEVLWSGVPSPQEKYVNIFRAVYQSDSGKEDTSTFKLAKKDAPAKTIIDDLKPGTRYRLWLEVYMTNGKIKKSNVQDFVTKPGVLLQGKLASVPINESDYYGPLVIVAIVATVSILMSLVLLMMLMKRRTSSKADISPRKTTSAYDNPSYKVELQQETMDL